MNKQKLLKFCQKNIDKCFNNLIKSEKQSEISYWNGIFNFLGELKERIKEGEFENE